MIKSKSNARGSLLPCLKALLSVWFDRGVSVRQPEASDGGRGGNGILHVYVFACSRVCMSVQDTQTQTSFYTALEVRAASSAEELIEMRGDAQVSANIAKPFVRVTSLHSHPIHLLSMYSSL